jgi:hypothetical protein
VGGMATKTWGPMLTANKSFFNKALKSSLSLAYNSSSQNGQQTSGMSNIRFTGAYAYQKTHQFNLNIVFLKRMGIEKIKSFTELTCTIGYSHQFKGLSTKKK